MAKKQVDNVYTRPALYKAFGINEATLLDLESRRVLSLAWFADHGLMRASVDAVEDRILRCAVFSPLNATKVCEHSSQKTTKHC